MSARLAGLYTEIDPPSLANPTLNFLKQYWDRKRGTRAMPSRADIRPAEMKDHLGSVVLVDVLPGVEDFRFRTIGTKVTRYMMGGATGKTVRDVFAPYGEAAVNGTLATYRKCARDKAIVHAWGGTDWLGRDFLDFESLYLPLSDDGGHSVNMVLSAITFEPAGQVKAKSKP